jgi:tetratricopeptide (TPR) repeat protein
MKTYPFLGCVLALWQICQNSTEMHHHAEPIAKLGSVSFSTSCSPSAQKPFDLGVTLLHSYWYEEAKKQFEDVAAKDPACAMAYWGQAMTVHRPAYSQPSEQDLKRGRELVQKAKSLSAKTLREREYIDALAGFYVAEKVDYEKRAAAWCAGMEKVYADNSADHEAAAFYALALLVSEPPDDKSLANSRKAIGILNRLLGEAPSHPGAAHYLIHAADNPNLAELGLPAARRYAQIAPAVPHALHMPSHIFARLGLWQEDIQSNLTSLAAARQPSSMHIGAENQVHAMEFLEYAYLQSGLDDEAQEMIDQLQSVRESDLNPGLEGYLDRQRAQFPARYALELRHWEEALALEPSATAEPRARAVTYWARAIAAGHLRDAQAAGDAAARYELMLEATRRSDRPYPAKSMETDRDEARAWSAFAEGKNEDALNLLRPLADKQDALGKGEVELPAREMLADMLLEMGRPPEALAEFEKSLRTDPHRFNGLYGAARAAELALQLEKAASLYEQLLKNCESAARTPRPEILHARSLLAERKNAVSKAR